MVVSKPTVTYLDDTYIFKWGEEQITMEISNLLEGSRSNPGLKGELTIESERLPNPGALQPPMIHNLLSSNTQLVNRLLKREPGLDWDGMLMQLNGASIKRHRQGGPLVDLAVTPEGVSPSLWLLPPVVSGVGATVWAADGGTGKSVLAVAVAVSVATNLAALGYAPRRVGHVMYVDWEADHGTHNQRLNAVWHGMGQRGTFPEGQIFYQDETGPLAQNIRRLRRRAEEINAELVIIDSLGQARGGAVGDDEATNAVFRAARSFPCPVLLIDHISKAQREGQVKNKTSIGSIYTRNNARLLWVLEGENSDAKNVVAFSPDKYNFGRVPKRQGFVIEFENEGDGYDETLKTVFFEAASISQIEAIISPAAQEAEQASQDASEPDRWWDKD